MAVQDDQRFVAPGQPVQPGQPAQLVQPGQPGQPPLSPDGRYWWTGSEWAPVGQPDWPGVAPAAYYGFPASADQSPDGLAIASLVLGILSFFGITAIAAVICGHISLSRIKRTGRGGYGLALAGTILGYAVGALLLLAIVLPIFLSTKHAGPDGASRGTSGATTSSDVGVRTDLRDIAIDEETYYVDNLSYTTDGAALSAEGPMSTANDQILVAAETDGYCVVGADISSGQATRWFVTESGDPGIIGPLSTVAAAEGLCTQTSGSFVPLAS